MRIVCTVAIGNRNLPSHNLKLQNRHVKSTLALCKHPKNENEFSLILFTAQNKNGTKYKLTSNVKTILTKFINDGKATIQLKEPPVDFYVQADQIQLKGFLMLMKRALEGKISSKELTLSTHSVSAVPQKNIAPKKLVITKRSEIPIKGYPRTLEELHINEIGLQKLSNGILNLQKLRILDLSDNLLESLPIGLKSLPIGELNVSKNQLFQSKNWDWIGGTLVRTLQTINLGENHLTLLPKNFIKLENLVNINLEKNNLATLPNSFGNFIKLRILNLSHNNLTVFPGSFARFRLEHLDISQNILPPIDLDQVVPNPLPVQTLKEISARKVLTYKFFYNAEIVPYTVVEYLDDAQYCVCGQPNFEVSLRHKNVIWVKKLSLVCVQTAGTNDYIAVDCHYCSIKCFKRNSRMGM